MTYFETMSLLMVFFLVRFAKGCANASMMIGCIAYTDYRLLKIITESYESSPATS